LDSISASLIFERAAEIFMAMRAVHARPGAIAARYVRLNTEKGYKRHSSSLALFFAGMTLGDIHWYHMRGYQEARVAGEPPFIRRRRPHEQPGPCPVKPQQVNQELSFLKRLKKLGLCWTAEDDRFYMELQEEESDVQRALSPEEQAHWLDTSRARPRWELIHWYSIAAFDTVTSTNEMRGLRLGDVVLAHRLMSIPWPAAKNKHRHRSIPLENADVLWAFERLLARAHGMGARDPQHYLFPFWETRGGRSPDPARHMSESGLKNLWQEVRDASGLKWFRPYDTRHTGGTRMAECGIPVDVIVARMGHASKRMREHYTHISTAAQRRWLKGTPQGGYAPRPEWNGVERRAKLRLVE
jgi:site-specific recombinase XerD